jgi:hypothetical protein
LRPISERRHANAAEIVRRKEGLVERLYGQYEGNAEMIGKLGEKSGRVNKRLKNQWVEVDLAGAFER